MTEWKMMKVCAMRLDKTVTAHDFVRAVEDISNEARREVYRGLAEYGEKLGADALLKKVMDRHAGVFTLEDT